MTYKVVFAVVNSQGRTVALYSSRPTAQRACAYGERVELRPATEEAVRAMLDTWKRDNRRLDERRHAMGVR